MFNASTDPVGNVCIPCLKGKIDKAIPDLSNIAAQEIVHTLSEQALAYLPTPLKQGLRQALNNNQFSGENALNKLYSASKTAAIDLLKQSQHLSDSTKQLLNPQLIENIYHAESKRLNNLEENILGRGQVPEALYQEVLGTFQEEIIEHGHNIIGNYQEDLNNPLLEDVITGGALALKVEAAQTIGRKAEDALKFGVAAYHGVTETINQVQEKLHEYTNYDPIASVLKMGSNKQQDIAAYIEEVTNTVNKLTF